MKHTQKGQNFTEIVLEIFKVNGLLVTEGDRLTKAFGLSSARWKVLGALEMSKDPLTVSQIARIMGLTRQAVQRLADAMKKDGLLDYQDNPQHKRANHVVLLDKGKDIYTLISEVQIPWANQKSKEIMAEDLKTTLMTLRKITSLNEYA
jgi:DNA-binding MarR family transcriptional regulator